MRDKKSQQEKAIFILGPFSNSHKIRPEMNFEIGLMTLQSLYRALFVYKDWDGLRHAKMTLSKSENEEICTRI